MINYFNAIKKKEYLKKKFYNNIVPSQTFIYTIKINYKRIYNYNKS
jgi:hypothetical protein